MGGPFPPSRVRQSERPGGPVLNSFTSIVVDLLPGPDWQLEARRAALQRADELDLPSPDEEAWRYSRIGDLQLDRYHPQSAPSDREDTFSVGLTEYSNSLATLIIRNGWIDELSMSAEAIKSGISVGPATEIANGQRLIGSVLDEPADLFGHLNRAFGPEPAAVVVPDGLQLTEPIMVVVHSDADAAALFPRLIVEVGCGASATVVELHTSADVNSLVVPVLEASVGSAGRLRHGMVQNLGPRVWQVGQQAFQVGSDATVEAFTAALGGDYARTRIDCRLVGRGAEGRLTAAYFGEGDQTLDFRTFQEHSAPDTTSDLLFKGVLDGESRSVYSGLIAVRPEAVRTRAHQTNRNVKLSAGAWAESVPNLEIETNDVVCSHASAVSPVDDEQRFYLESRGVPTLVAERLLVEGFFDEVVKAAPVAALGEAVRSSLAERLDRRTGRAVAT